MTHYLMVYPFKMTIFHILAYQQENGYLLFLIRFFIEEQIMIPPLKDIFGNTVFDLAFNQQNLQLLTLLTKYYSNHGNEITD